MSDKLDKEAIDESVAKAIEAEEFERKGVSVKRDPLKLMDVRDRLNAEERVREAGNVFQRGCIFVSKR